MNSSIHLHAHLLATARRQHDIGQDVEAKENLQKLLQAGDLTPDVIANAHSLLGEIEFGFGRFRQARRHFAVVISLRQYDSETCLRYADTVDADPNADPHKAWQARRRATRIDSFDSHCWTTFGQSCLRINDRKAAVKAFRRAARLRPERFETLASLVDGFVVVGRPSEALEVLTAARFRRPQDAAILGLWNRFQFERARRRQFAKTSDCEATILRFPGREATKAAEDARPIVLRADRRSRAVPHLLRLFGMNINPRRAN